jgi:hypothetical protein
MKSHAYVFTVLKLSCLVSIVPVDHTIQIISNIRRCTT